MAKDVAKIRNREKQQQIAVTIEGTGKAAEIVSSVAVDVGGDKVKNEVNPPNND